MATESEETFHSLHDLDEEDLWVRGRVYVHYKRLLEQAEARIFDPERHVARARYECEITQRIQGKVTDPQAYQDWEIRASVSHDFVVMAEHELAEETDNVAYYRAMVTEIESDLGDKAQEDLKILTLLDWEDEDWDVEYLDEFGEFVGEFANEYKFVEFDPRAPIPFADDFTPDNDDEGENDQVEGTQAHHEEASL